MTTMLSRSAAAPAHGTHLIRLRCQPSAKETKIESSARRFRYSRLIFCPDSRRAQDVTARAEAAFSILHQVHGVARRRCRFTASCICVIGDADVAMRSGDVHCRILPAADLAFWSPPAAGLRVLWCRATRLSDLAIAGTRTLRC